MEKVVIDRFTWQNVDHKYGPTSLLNNSNRMCCLGFFCIQVCNLEKETIRNITGPINLVPRLGSLDVAQEFEFFDGAMHINDRMSGSDDEREEAIIKHFANYGYELEFIGRYPTEEELSNWQKLQV